MLAKHDLTPEASGKLAGGASHRKRTPRPEGPAGAAHRRAVIDSVNPAQPRRPSGAQVRYAAFPVARATG